MMFIPILIYKSFLLNVKVRLGYKIDFLISLFGMASTQFVSLFILYIVFENTETLDGWSESEVIFIYGFSLLTKFANQAFLDNLWNLKSSLTSGDFLIYKLKPVNSLVFYASRVFDFKSLLFPVLGGLCIAYSWREIEIQLDILYILNFIFLMVVSSIIVMAISVISASTGFWTMAPEGLLLLVNRLSEYSHIPYSIYGNSTRFLLTYIVPFIFVAYVPGSILLQRNVPDNAVLNMIGCMSILVLIATWAWAKGSSQYDGTGS